MGWSCSSPHLARVRPADVIVTGMGIATGHHILKLEMGEGKSQDKQTAHGITNLGLTVGFPQGTITALDSFVPEVTNGHIHHSLGHR